MMLLADLQMLVLVGLAIVGTIAALMYFGGPVLIYFTHRQAARPNLVAFKPGVTPLPADVDQFFHTTSWALAQQGFEIVTGAFMPSQVENVVAALIFLVNRQEQHAAVAIAIHNKTPGAATTIFHTEFVTRFHDGRVVQTNNAQPLNAFPVPPQCTNSYLPSVYDPAELYRLHQALCGRQGSSRKVLPLLDHYGGDALRYLVDAIIEELEAAAAAGYMRLDSAGGVYRPTPQGALLMTYGELWPMKGIRLMRRKQRERKLLAELAQETSAAQKAKLLAR